jgi:hypothetical protein
MMNDPRALRQAEPGLCSRCVHVQLITNARGSVFYLCRLSSIDPTFPRYPRIPVLQCSGFVPNTQPEER